MSEYADELERAKARHAEKSLSMRLTMRARRLLGLAGWSATEEQLREAAAGMSKVDQYKPSDLDAAIARALEIQNDESERGRRVRPEEINMGKPTVDRPTREKIRSRLLKLRTADPDLTAPQALEKITAEFDVAITIENFYVTYWGKVSKELEANSDGKAPEAAAEKKDEPAAETPPQQPAAVAAAPAEPAAKQQETEQKKAPAATPAIGDLPYFSLTPLDGRVRVQFDVTVDVRSAALLTNQIGGALFSIAAGGR